MKKLAAFFFILFLPHAGWGSDAPSGKNSEAPFEVEARIKESSLDGDTYKQAGRFYVNTAVRNTSSKAQRIVVWVQQGWSWVTDSPDVTPGTEAMDNYPSNITLKPGQEYDGIVEMIAGKGKKPPFTFRMGFFAKAGDPVSNHPEIAGSRAIIWSAPLTLEK